MDILLPDGSKMAVADGATAADVAAATGPRLAKAAIAAKVGDKVVDLTAPLTEGDQVSIITATSPEALDLIRHSAAHVMAAAVFELYPQAKFGVGPAVDNGFYYDFARNDPFVPEDLPVIEKKMREIIARDKPFTKEEWSREKAKQVFRDNGEMFKVELVDAIPSDQTIKIYKQGDWFDLCRGPHMTSTGKVGNAFKLMNVAGAYWRGDSRNPMLTRIYGTAFANQEALDAYLKQIEEEGDAVADELATP